MTEEQATFYSDGLKLAGSFYWPDDVDGGARQSVTIACSGFTGLRCIHPARFARYLTKRGHACFGFDYRGCADSEGPAGRVLLTEQVRDIIHAAAFVSADARVDARRLFLLGWGMGAGLVLDAARAMPGVIGLIAANGFYSGARVQRAHRGDDAFRAFCQQVAVERRERVRTGKAATVDPFDVYPLDAQSRAYVDNVLRKTPGYEAERYSMELADSLLRWDAESLARTLDIPLLVAHGAENRLHPPSEAESLHAVYSGPKTLFWLEGAGHTEFMHDDDPKFQRLAGRICDWMNERLGS